MLFTNSFSVMAKALDTSPSKRAQEFRHVINPGRKTPGLITLRESRVNAAGLSSCSYAISEHYSGSGEDLGIARKLKID